MELQILHWINDHHQVWLTPIMKFFTDFGEMGIGWIVIAILCLAFKRTRKLGLTLVLALIMMYIIGELTLKPLVARARPCQIDTSVSMLIPCPKQFSFPSGHSYASFASSMVIYLYHKRWGLLAFAVAIIVAMSRLYFFVHFPTDILAGALLGIATGFVAMKIMNRKRV